MTTKTIDSQMEDNYLSGYEQGVTDEREDIMDLCLKEIDILKQYPESVYAAGKIDMANLIITILEIKFQKPKKTAKGNTEQSVVTTN